MEKPEAQGSIGNVGRNIYICGEITEEVAVEVTAAMIELQATNIMEPITLYINSFGGDVYATLSIVDVMDAVVCPVNTVCIGKAMSGGAIIFINGENRLMSKHSRLMLHQVNAGLEGSLKDVRIAYRETQGLNESIAKLISLKSKMELDEVHVLIDRDSYFGWEAAVEKGLCDGLLENIG